jgi:putative membrane protein
MTQPFRSNRVLQGILLCSLAIWVVTAIDPLYPRDWLLENLLVFFCAILLAATYRHFRFSNISYALFAVFLGLHLVGAHYTYAETPFGFWLQDWFGFERNHYDRIVHFAFGLLLAWPLRELLLRRAGTRKAWSGLLALACVMASSAAYEIIEMLAAIVVSPELGAAYLGTQGDEWDAQKDAAMAGAGAVLAMGTAWWWERYRAPGGGFSQPH